VCRHLLAALLFIQISIATAGNAQLSSTGETPLDSFVEYVEDSNNSYDIDSIRGAGIRWQPNGDDTFNRGYSSSGWWLKLRVENPAAETQKQLLEIAYAALDHVDVT
jgi:hypothetical protein